MVYLNSLESLKLLEQSAVNEEKNSLSMNNMTNLSELAAYCSYMYSILTSECE